MACSLAACALASRVNSSMRRAAALSAAAAWAADNPLPLPLPPPLAPPLLCRKDRVGLPDLGTSLSQHAFLSNLHLWHRSLSAQFRQGCLSGPLHDLQSHPAAPLLTPPQQALR